MKYFVLPVVALLSACATVQDMQLSPAGAKVQVVENKLEQCEQLGLIEAAWWDCREHEEYVINRLRNLAAQKHATHLRIKTFAKGVQSTGCTGEAYAYRCR